VFEAAPMFRAISCICQMDGVIPYCLRPGCPELQIFAELPPLLLTHPRRRRASHFDSKFDKISHWHHSRSPSILSCASGWMILT
jgi:hypothetical protein